MRCQQLINFCFTFSLVVTVSLFAQTTQAQNAAELSPRDCKLRVAWSPWPPFIEGQSKPSGIHIDLVNWIGKTMNCQLIYQRMTWADSVEAIRSGKTDLLGRASLVEARKKFALFSEPYRESLIVLYVRRGVSKQYKASSVEDLLKQGFKIGLQKGAYYGDIVMALKAKPEYKSNFPEYTFTNGPPVDLLLNNSIDGLLESPYTMDSISLKSFEKSLIEEYPLEIFSETLHFIFSQKSVSPEFVDKFNQAIIDVRKTPEYQKHWFWKAAK